MTSIENENSSDEKIPEDIPTPASIIKNEKTISDKCSSNNSEKNSKDPFKVTAVVVSCLAFIATCVTIFYNVHFGHINSRAYVVINSYTVPCICKDIMPPIDTIVKMNFSPTMNIEVKNFGRSPAYNVSCWGCYRYDTTDKWIDTLRQTMSDISDTTSGGFTLTEVPLYFDHNISMQPFSDSINLVITGKIKLFYYGDLTYEDIFGTRHFTQFCAEYVSAGRTQYFRFGKKHNGSD